MTTDLVCGISITLLMIMVIFLLSRLNRMRKFAYADDLTGLRNFRSFAKDFHTLIKNAATEPSGITVAIVDIDNFRRFNHESYRLGDAVLKEFCTLLTEVLPPDSISARFKIGDEFIIAFPHSGKAQAEQYLKRLLAVCASSDFVCLSSLPGFAVSFSYGIAVYQDKEELDLTIDRAELALRACKSRS